MTTVVKDKTNGNGRTSDIKKMERGVELWRRLDGLSEKIRQNYSVNELPAWVYSDCKAVSNYIEGFAHETKIKPSTLEAIRLKKGRRVPIISKRVKNKSRLPRKGTNS